MVKVPGPLMSTEAHGWLGGDTYGRKEYEKGVWIPPKGVNPCPYPIGFASKITIPNAWTFSFFGNTYKVPRFGLRPYGPFISAYYSPMGWCYQRRRTWHGVTWAAMRPPISINKKTPFQLGYQGKFRDAVTIWHGMSYAQQDVYNHWSYPRHASGFNRFISWYLNHTSVVFVLGDSLLLENGGHLIQEDGGRIFLEHFYVLTEAGEFIITEAGDKLTGES